MKQPSCSFRVLVLLDMIHPSQDTGHLGSLQHTRSLSKGMHLMIAHVILYIHDQDRSTSFYTAVLQQAPRLYVPGMTEYQLTPASVLGLMPERGIVRLLGPSLPDPRSATGIPRAELYLVVDDAESYHQRALQHGATEVSGLALRSWGERVAYSLDLDGHVLAFAEPGSHAKA